MAGCARPEADALPAASTTTAPRTTTTTAPTTTTPPPSTRPPTRAPSTPPTTATPAATTAADKPVVRLGEYTVLLTGTVAATPFHHQAQLSVTGTIDETGAANGVNALDVCLVAGVPGGEPHVGAVWFGSNTGCFPIARADTDLAHTTVTATTVTIESDAAAAGHNAFVATPGLCPHPAASGRMEVRFGPDGTVAGSITALGQSGACATTGQPELTATFTGTVL